MSFSDIEKMVATTPREVVFTVEGKPTNLTLILRHESDEEIQDFMRNHRAKVQDLMLKRKNTELKALTAKNEIDLRAIHVIGWKWDEGDDPEQDRPPFSKKELKARLNSPKIGYHLGKFIDQEVGSLEDFLERSGND